jgi:hypothetical protein
MKSARRKSEFMLAIAVLLVAGLWPCESASAGRLVAWGWNENGQCDVPSGNDFIAIATKWKHNLAIRADGSIAGWGHNNHGQADPPAGNDFVAIATGTAHSLALKSDGSLFAWGYNGNGQCDVPAGNDFVAIAGGHNHNVAIRSDGSPAAWGDNHWEQCNVIGGYDYVAVSAALQYSIALKSNGRLVGWGEHNIGYGYDLVAIAAGGFLSSHGIGLEPEGSLRGWGDNTYGQRTVPDGNDFVAIAAGVFHSLALKSDGSVVAWGRNDDGQCDVPSLENVVAIAAGSSHSLALLEEPIDNLPPIADAGDDIIASANEEITLDAGNSSDPDGEIILYTWMRLPDEVIIYSGDEPTCQTRALGRAEEVIELTVMDNSEGTASDTLKIVNRMLQDLQGRIDSTQVGDLNQDHEVNMVDFALLAEYWLY